MRGQFHTHFLDSPTGARLALRKLKAVGAAKGIIMVNHGMAEHAGRYLRFAEAMARENFCVGVHDHRGHGHTTAPDAPRGVFGGWQNVIDDSRFIHDQLVSEYGDLPVIVLGHSMGGVITANQMLAEHQSLAGVGIWNANLNMGSLVVIIRWLMRLESLFKDETAESDWMYNLTFKTFGKTIENARTDRDWLSRIPAEVDRYIDDPDAGWRATISLWRDFSVLVERASADDRLDMVRKDLPIHLAGGGADPATQNAKATRAFAARLYELQFSDVTLRIDPEGRHETLNDLGYEDAMADFASWADAAVDKFRTQSDSSTETG